MANRLKKPVTHQADRPLIEKIQTRTQAGKRKTHAYTFTHTKQRAQKLFDSNPVAHTKLSYA